MFWASKLQQAKVFDVVGRPLGTIKDLVASLSTDYPVVTALFLRGGPRRDLRVSWRQVRSFEESEVYLACRQEDVAADPPREDEVHLVRDLLDKQIVDTEGRKLIRVQDLQLARVDGKIRLMAVDISLQAILRRLGLGFVAEGLARRLPPQLIDWRHVNLLTSPGPNVRLKVSHKNLALLHPADIADIVNELTPEQRTAVLASLDSEVAADTIEEMHEPFQATTLSEMESEKAADVLEEMAPDNAADVLADMPEDKAQELLSLMEVEGARDVRELLAYPEDTAGGIMTTEYVSVPLDVTAREAIERIRAREPEAETVYYLYVVDAAEHLLGVFSLRDLIMAPPERRVADFMHKKLIAVSTHTKQEEVAKLVAKYNLLAIPVVDAENRLQGIVTVDDAIDVVIPTAWKKRFPRIYA